MDAKNLWRSWLANGKERVILPMTTALKKIAESESVRNDW
jgi:hypothetical protein